MSKYFPAVVILIGLNIGWALPARADIEAISATIKGLFTNIQKEYQTAQSTMESATKLKDTVEQGVGSVMDNVDKIADVAADPSSLVGEVKSLALGGLQDALDGSKNEDELVEDVTENYTREYGADNNITKAKKLQASLNNLNGKNAAILYGRALVLRQELMKEENPEHSLETIDEAQQASNEMNILSMRRWNKILEMQAYINEYKKTIAIQNFTRKAEESADEK